MATLSSLRTQILQVFKRTDKDTEVDQAINDTVDELMSLFPNRFNHKIQFIETTVGREEYPTPPTALRINHPLNIIDPTDTSGKSGSFPLKFIPPDEYNFWEPNPDAGYIKLLLHFDGESDNQTFSDSSPSAHQINTFGNTKYSYAQYVFGASSALFDGSGDYLTVADHSDFDFSGGIWEVDMRLRTTELVSNRMIFSKSTDTNNRLTFFLDGNGALSLELVSNGAVSLLVKSSNSVIAINTWYHVSVSENGNTFKIFVNGTDVTSSGGTDTNRIPRFTGALNIGISQFALTEGWNGYIDEFRILNGSSTISSFTVPTSAYTDYSVNTGKPWAYTVKGNHFFFTPVPDNQYRIRVDIDEEPSLLAVAGDTTQTRRIWDQTIKAGALARLFEMIGLSDKARDWIEVYQKGFSGAGGILKLIDLERDFSQAPYLADFNPI